MLAFLSAENENRQLEDLPLAIMEIMTFVVFVIMIQESANALYDCYSRIMDAFIFIH